MAFKRILIINIFGIGDVLFTTPLLASIKQARPDVFIGYLANRRTAPLLEENPHVDKVHVYERDDFQRIYQRSPWAFWRQGKAFLRTIKDERYDLVIDLSLNTSFSFLMALIGIPQRVGFDFKNRSPFLTRKIPLDGYEGKHVVEYYLDILPAIGIEPEVRQMALSLQNKDIAWAEKFLLQKKKSKGPLIAVIPGGGASWGKDAAYKRWGASKFAKLADNLIEKYSCQIILLGDENETGLCSDIASRMRHEVLTVCGLTTLGQMAALLQRCDLVVLNDGGPLHVAVAVGARTVSIFGPVDDKVYGPYPSDGHKVASSPVACRPCYRQFRRAACDHISCLERIEVTDVLRKVEEILK